MTKIERVEKMGGGGRGERKNLDFIASGGTPECPDIDTTNMALHGSSCLTYSTQTLIHNCICVYNFLSPVVDAKVSETISQCVSISVLSTGPRHAPVPLRF